MTYFDIADVPLGFDHVARLIVNANHGFTAFASFHRTESRARHCRLNAERESRLSESRRDSVRNRWHYLS